MKKKIYTNMHLTDITTCLVNAGLLPTGGKLLETTYKRHGEMISFVHESEEELTPTEISTLNLSSFLSKQASVRMYNAVMHAAGLEYNRIHGKKCEEYNRQQTEATLIVKDILEMDSRDLTKYRNFGSKSLNELREILRNEKISEDYPILRKIC